MLWFELWCRGSSPNGSRNQDRSPVMRNWVMSGSVFEVVNQSLRSCRRVSRWVLVDWDWQVSMCSISSSCVWHRGQCGCRRRLRATITVPVGRELLSSFVMNVAIESLHVFLALRKDSQWIFVRRTYSSAPVVDWSLSTKLSWVILL